MRTFIKSFKLGNASQTMFMNKFHIENQAHITISMGKVGFYNTLRDAPCSECDNRLLTRNPLVHLCLLLYVFLQHIGKNCVAANAEGCLYVQH